MALCFCVFLLFSLSTVALEKTQAATVFQQCEKDTNTFLQELKQVTPEEYAITMYDAFGKIGSNVKGGNVNRPGLLQQCHSAYGPTFSGQYCMVFLRQGKLQYFVGICVPDSCSKEDVKMLALQERLQLDDVSLIPPLPSILVNQSNQEMIATHCLSKTIVPDASVVTCLCVCCIMIAVPLVATLFTAIRKWQRNREVGSSVDSSCINTDLNSYGTLKSNVSSSSDTKRSNSNDNKSTSHPAVCFLQTCLERFLQAFSLQHTSRGVLSTTSSISGGGYASLNGIRVLSLLWIICGHTAEYALFSNMVDNYNTWIKKSASNPLHVFSFSGPIYLAVDTFLLLGGLLSARSLLSSINRAEGKLSVSVVANYIFNRIKRIQPLHMFIICLCTGLFPLVQNGPYWFSYGYPITFCKKSWWTNLLLIQNFFSFFDMCINWSWYLAVDFQCYITTPLLLYIYRKNRRVFAAVVGALLLLTTVAGSIVTALLQLPVFQPPTASAFNYMSQYYEKPYTRYGPFLIGILSGIYLTTKKDQLINRKWQVALGWFCSLSLMAVVVALAYVLKETPDYPSVPHALYQGLHRTTWALAVTWIIVACEEGYGGFIKSFLSLGIWIPLSSISFAFYMSHPIVIILHIYMQETPIHYTDLNFMYLFLGHVVLSMVLSYMLTVLVEKPYLLKYNRT